VFRPHDVERRILERQGGGISGQKLDCDTLRLRALCGGGEHLFTGVHANRSAVGFDERGEFGQDVTWTTADVKHMVTGPELQAVALPPPQPLNGRPLGGGFHAGNEHRWIGLPVDLGEALPHTDRTSYVPPSELPHSARLLGSTTHQR